MNFLAGLFENIFEIRPRIKKVNSEYRLNVYSKPIRIFFEKVFEMPFEQNNWSTPKIIEKNEKAWIWYISGFFDAEGYCTSKETFKRTGKGKITFSQNNRKSLEFIKNALEYYGIRSGKLFLEKDGRRHSLNIQSKESILRFVDTFKIVRKHSQLLELRDLLRDT